MDLLEIRKKAREAKEARAAKPAEPSESSLQPLPGAVKKAEKRAPRKKKKSRETTADAGTGIIQPEEIISPVPEPEEESSVSVDGSEAESVQDAAPLSPPADIETVVEASQGMGKAVSTPAADADSASEEGDSAVTPSEAKAALPPAGKASNAAPGVEAVSAPSALPEKIELLSFMLAGEEYALKMEEAREIIRWRKPTKVPRSPEHIIGIISLRGIILPVFDVKKRLGLGETKPSRRTRIIVVSDGGTSLSGMVVDSITGVTDMPREGIEPPPSVINGSEAEFIEGVGRAGGGGGRLLILIKTSRALSA